jgi:Domain of Unknown Function with PDB structure (DUF3857)/Transglutaminase-like superfamily
MAAVSKRTLVVSLLSVIFVTRFAGAQNPVPINISWDPISPAERQLSAPVVEKDAGVEALFWNIHVQDEFFGQDLRRSLNHYVRLKVFDEKGKEKTATIDIEYGSHTSIVNVAARTVKADGSIVELKRDAVYKRDLVRSGGTKIKVVSFAVPGVEPGAIVEYRYKEIRDDPQILYARLQMQREYPVQKITYYVKPLPNDYSGGYRMSVWPFGCKPSPFKPERDGFDSFFVENVPAFHEEPMMPGEPNVRWWVLMLYRKSDNTDAEKYWTDIGKKWYDRLKQSVKVDDELKKAAAEVTSGAKNQDEKLAALAAYVRKQVKGYYDPGVSDADRNKVMSKLPKDRLRTAPEVFKSGMGSSDDRNLVFAALASSVGIEARPALLPSRNDILFDPKMADEYFLDSIDMAVKSGDTWKLYDVSAHRLPPGMLTWGEEGVQALLSDPKKPSFIISPSSPPEASLIRRKGRLTLDEEGTLEGDVEEAFSGHSAEARREELDGESEAKQLELVKERVSKVFSTAELSNVSIKNIDQAAQPLELQYHVKIPGYATRTAKRILLQPLYFERGAGPVFTAATRRYAISFPYAWKESDDLVIQLPAGFVIDQAASPAPMNFGPTGSYAVHMSVRNKKELVITRDLIFGNEGQLNYEQKVYPQVKNVFDQIYGADTKALTLRQEDGGAQ